jgi:holliday junction DNA helicase RuvA
MIAWLEGYILEKNPPTLVLAANGVGYLVETSMQTFFQLPEENQKITLHIHTIVREDAHLLYGFSEKAEREMFQLLIKVNGIGPKSALGILSGMEYKELAQCIAMKNSVALGKLPGIGKKTAERLVIEMQDKIKNLSYIHAGSELENSVHMGNLSNLTQPFGRYSPVVQDAMGALLSLGYKSQQIVLAIESMDIADKNSEQIIREALKYFVRT